MEVPLLGQAVVVYGPSTSRLHLLSRGLGSPPKPEETRSVA